MYKFSPADIQRNQMIKQVFFCNTESNFEIKPI